MLSKDEIFAKVQEVLVDALGVDDDEVTAEATLTGDLGAESIDFLDIQFRLDKAFDTQIPREELVPENILSGDSGYVKDGRVTAEGIAALRKKMPHADIDSFAADPRIENFQNVYTVQMVVNFLDRKLNDNADRRAA
jgi:acyl carrier protein